MRFRADLKADAVLVLTTMIWGTTFPFSKDILERWPPIAYLALRMGLSALLLAVIFRGPLARAGSGAWRAGTTLGVLLGLGLAGQVVGQVYTTASKSAFITGLTTPLVPFVAYLLLRARPSRENLAGVVLASLGGALILAPAGEAGVNTGDVITLFCTSVFAAHITLTSVYARRHDVRALTAAQIVVAAALLVSVWALLRGLGAAGFGADDLPAAFAREFEPVSWDAPFLWRFAYMVVVATVLNFLMWTWAQGRMTATHAAVIFSLEPVFATLFAVWMRGGEEWMGGRANLGALLILAGVVVSELRWGNGVRGDKGEAEGPGSGV
jgi:drug/metabolite transporter (DMT)-like permease